MSRSRRFAWLRVAAILLLTAAAWAAPKTASAWHGRGFGWGYRPWLGARFAPGFSGGWGYGGWGYGGSRFIASESVYLGGPFGGFFSGDLGIAPGTAKLERDVAGARKPGDAA